MSDDEYKKVITELAKITTFWLELPLFIIAAPFVIIGGILFVSICLPYMMIKSKYLTGKFIPPAMHEPGSVEYYGK